MDTFNITDLGQLGYRKDKLEYLSSKLINTANNSDLYFILVAYSEKEGINILAGSGSKTKLKSLNKQVKKYIKKL